MRTHDWRSLYSRTVDNLTRVDEVTNYRRRFQRIYALLMIVWIGLSVFIVNADDHIWRLDPTTELDVISHQRPKLAAGIKKALEANIPADQIVLYLDEMGVRSVRNRIRKALWTIGLSLILLWCCISFFFMLRDGYIGASSQRPEQIRRYLIHGVAVG
jgi:membrane associated rhomboid family serine protease